jgi:hypothetical protein
MRRALLTDLERSGESQISLTDPDSRAMAAHTKVGVGYNIQVAVDAKNKMIVDQEVTNQVVDIGLLTQTAKPARAILEVATIDVVADRGTFKIEDIATCERAGMTPMFPSRNGDHRGAMAFSARMSFAPTRRATHSFVRPARSCRRPTKPSIRARVASVKSLLFQSIAMVQRQSYRCIRATMPSSALLAAPAFASVRRLKAHA